MKTFTAKQLHENPSKVYAEAHREPIKINHRSHGDFILLSPVQVLSKHTNLDESVMLHLRGLESDIKKPAKQAGLSAACP